MLPYTFEKQGCGNFHPDQIGDGHGHGSEAKGWETVQVAQSEF